MNIRNVTINHACGHDDTYHIADTAPTDNIKRLSEKKCNKCSLQQYMVNSWFATTHHLSLMDHETEGFGFCLVNGKNLRVISSHHYADGFLAKDEAEQYYFVVDNYSTNIHETTPLSLVEAQAKATEYRARGIHVVLV